MYYSEEINKAIKNQKLFKEYKRKHSVDSRVSSIVTTDSLYGSSSGFFYEDPFIDHISIT